MPFLILGGLALIALMFALGLFSGAQVKTVKQFGIWTVAIGGLLLAVLLLFTGRGALAVGDLLTVGMLVWPWIKQQRMGGGFTPGARPGAGGTRQPGRSGMTREEALAVLGLKPGAEEEEIRSAHKRLMRMAHPDNGGSDWLASRLNQARDTLLA